MAPKGKGKNAAPESTVTRRDFIHVLAGGVGGIAVAATVWPMVDQMNPSADVLALSSTEVDLSQIDVGQTIIVIWRKQPVFIRHRTAEEITEAENTPLSDLKDPEADQQRVERPEWLIMIGICTHLGCIPIGERGDYGGWFCPCHGSHYDTSGRIRKGPAPTNLLVPDYMFETEDTVIIGRVEA